MTEATLGFKIDSTPAATGAADLDKLTAAAVRTTQAVDKLEAEAAGLGTVLKKAGDDARTALPPVESLGRSFGSQDDHVRAFRMEVERLTLKFRPLAQATQQYEAMVGEIQRAHKLGAITAQEMTAAIDRERQAFERLKTSATAAGSAVKAANNNRGGAQSFNSANAAFQFQDIAVTAAMGMNPLMIGLQQGTQLASVVGSMERPVSGLAAAFTSLLNPVSLITIGLTAGTAALIQYFTTAESGTEKTSKLFEEQNDVIRRAATLWGDAVPQLKAYVDELDRADKITQGREASEILAGRELDGLGERLQGVSRQFSEAVRGLRGIDADPAFVRDFSQAFGDLRERLDDGTASVADYNRAQMALSEAVDRYGVKSVLSFRDAFDLITQSIRKSIEASREARLAWIAGIAGGTNVQDIVGGSTFTQGGRTFRSADFVPFNVPTPGRRPNIELGGDPEQERILNGDGRLTDIPVPGRRPNFFELEEQKEKVDDVTKAYRQAQDAKADFWLDMSFQERQAERSAMDRQVASTLNRYGFDENLNSPEANAIRGQLRREQSREAIGGFITDLRDGLLSSGGDIGKAVGDAIKNALINALAKASDQAIERITNSLVNAMFGGTSLSSSSGFATSGISGATTTLGAVLGVGGKAVANDNVSVSGSGAQLAWNFWKSKGLADHQVAGVLGNIKAESAFNPLAIGDSGNAFGLYQHNDRRNSLFNAIGGKGNLGNALSQHEFAYSELMGPENRAWQALTNARNAREATAAFAGFERPSGFSWKNPEAAHNFVGRLDGAEEALAKFGGTAQQATEGLGQLSNGLGQLGSTLSAGASGGGGGLLSALSGIGRSIFASSGQFASAWMGGGIGLYANGTNNAPGGLSIVGERGPELLNLPQGSGVMSNHKLMEALNDNRGQSGPSGAGTLNVHIIGANGDDHVRKLVQQGVSQGLSQYNEQQRRGGFGTTQKQYSSQKG